MELGGIARIFRRDATELGQAPVGQTFSLAFLDPPYGKALAEPAARALLGGWLARDALVVTEETRAHDLRLPMGLRTLETRQYADTQIVIARVDTG